MNSPVRPWHSLKTRVTLLTLVIFVLGMAIVTVWTSHMLREDMQTEMEKQQFSTATMVATEINHELTDRLHAIELAAGDITPALMADVSALQLHLQQRPVLQAMFNAGLFVTWGDGTAVASVPESYERVGVNYMELKHMAPALVQGKSAISPVALGKQLHTPVFSMVTPIRDAKGQTMGVFVGVINLGAPNFIDKIISHRYGNTGSYVLVDRAQRLIVTGTDKRSVMQALPLPGVNHMADRFVAGFEGAGVGMTPAGEEVLVAAKTISVANWYVAAHLSTAEAFAPIDALQQRMWWAIALLTLLATTLTWWMLHHQLAPLVSTAAKLATLPDNSQFPAELPVTRNDEIGRLITGFNQLLKTLSQRDAVLQDKQHQLDQLVHEQNTMLNNNLVGIVRVGERKVKWANQAFVNMTGYALQEMLGQSTRLYYPSDAAFQAFADVAYPLLQHGLEYRGQIEFRQKNGTPFWVDLSGAMLQGSANESLWIFWDVTQSRQANDQLRKLTRAVEQAPVGIVITDLTGAIEYSNPCVTLVTGYSADELRGQNPRVLHSGLTPAPLYEELWQTLLTDKVWRGEFQNRKKNGEVFVEQAVIAPVHDSEGVATHFVAVKQDITQRKQADEALQNSLREKVALLNEVHHRVKNNLQVITSLLRLEAGRSNQPDTKSVLQEMQGRIRSMALLHETLYRSGIFASVNLADYLKQLATQAFRAQNHGGVQLQLALNPVQVSMDMATPCGLLVNELISNSLKHAFPDGRKGVVTVSLQPVDQPQEHGQTWSLRVGDNGIGLPEDFEHLRHQSLGLQLACDLARQLGSVLNIQSGPDVGTGASFSMLFSPASINSERASLPGAV